MAKGRKTGGRNFQKGNKAGVGFGRPKFPPALKAIKRFTAEELEELITLLFHTQKSELKKLVTTEDGPAIKHAVASVLFHAIESGSGVQLESLLNRIIGKVKDTIKHEGLKPSIMELTDGRQIAFGVEQSEEE